MVCVPILSEGANMLKHHGQRTSRAALTGILAVLLCMVLGSWSCSKGDQAGKVATVTIGENPNETKALIYIAEERGLFAANGINVVSKNYESGVTAAKGLVKGEVDLATSAEFVTVGNILKNEPVRIIACIDRFESTYIIGRNDKGITGISNLMGKRIGVARQTSTEFYLGRFLDLHGMSIKQLTLVNVSPAQSVHALASGSVDGVAVIQPHANTIRQNLGDGVVVWPAQSGQLGYFNVISTLTWTASHPEVILRFLRSLIQAENYAVRHPNEAKAIVRKRLQYDDAYINAVWPEHQFFVSLDQGLIVAMEDEARWMIRNNFTNEKQIPDFLNYIHVNELKAVRAEAVNIIE